MKRRLVKALLLVWLPQFVRSAANVDDDIIFTDDDGFFPLITPIGVPAGIFGGDPSYPSPAACSAFPACSHLDGNCCPTSITGTFLDCCEESTVETEASCSANPGCVGLDGDCCPSSPFGKDLYCCYQPGQIEGAGYRPEFAFYGHPQLNNQAVYFTSTGQHVEFQDKIFGGDDNDYWTIEYTRDVNSLYDLVYFRTDAITNAFDYVSGQRKFYITIDETTAPPCTQIILQLDHLPTAQADNYPTGRHSRYLATYTAENGGRLEFDFLDRPDENNSVADNAVNAIALLFDPGVYAEQQWRWSFLDAALVCSNNEYAEDNAFCSPSPLKRCQAVHVGATTCECDNPACTAANDMCSLSYAESYLALEDRRTTTTTTAESGSGRRIIAGRRWGLCWWSGAILVSLVVLWKN